MYQSLFETSFGLGLVTASEVGMLQVCLPPIGEPQEGRSSSEITRRAASLLTRYWAGEAIDFEGLPVDLTGVSPFRQQILHLAALIPYGRVQTYGDLAREAGYPAAARAVGGAMAANPIPIIIPCHRVVAASGQLTGYSAPGGLIMKKYLLCLEGVDFRGERVVL